MARKDITAARKDASPEEARRALTSLRDVPERIRSLRIDIDAGDGETSIDLPPSTLSLVVDVLMILADGTQPLILARDTELTTQKAADILNVSRPYLVALLEEGAIPFHMVGSHRRLLTKDVLTYKEARRKKSEQAMAELAKESQEWGLDH